MAKRRASARRARPTKVARRLAIKRRSVKRPTKRASTGRAKTTKSRARSTKRAPKKTPRLERARRILDETVPTPPSSLNMDWRGSAARTGRAGLIDSAQKHRGMPTSITGGDVDVDVEDAYFTGDGAPGGDNPGPDQEVVEEIGKALGVEYEDSEELKSSDKIGERDRHRWELDPASSDDYKDRK